MRLHHAKRSTRIPSPSRRPRAVVALGMPARAGTLSKPRVPFVPRRGASGDRKRAYVTRVRVELDDQTQLVRLRDYLRSHGCLAFVNDSRSLEVYPEQTTNADDE